MQYILIAIILYIIWCQFVPRGWIGRLILLRQDKKRRKQYQQRFQRTAYRKPGQHTAAYRRSRAYYQTAHKKQRFECTAKYSRVA